MSLRWMVRSVFIAALLYLFLFGSLLADPSRPDTLIALTSMGLSFFVLLLDLFTGLLGKD